MGSIVVTDLDGWDSGNYWVEIVNSVCRVIAKFIFIIIMFKLNVGIQYVIKIFKLKIWHSKILRTLERALEIVESTVL